jgi:flagellar hook assembly protein FlgD
MNDRPDSTWATFRGGQIFKGYSSVNNSQYNAGFIVPDDVSNGNTGMVLSYLWDATHKKDYVNYYNGVVFSDEAVAVDTLGVPQIELFLNSMDYQDGDNVSANPLLIAKISDQNGINVTNASGHAIMLIIDQTASITNVTDYFTYNNDSCTDGILQYQIAGLSKGNHKIQLVAFNNLNQPSVTSTNFTVAGGNELTISDFMPYPNPMKKDGYFTFVISESADVKLAIYTVRGKKIKTVSSSAAKGYNQIYWDGRDADGDFIANNTYFIKLTAKSLSGNNKAEKTEKLIIYH